MWQPEGMHGGNGIGGVVALWDQDVADGRWREGKGDMEEADWIGAGIGLEVGRAVLSWPGKGDGECSFKCVRSTLLSR